MFSAFASVEIGILNWAVMTLETKYFHPGR